MPITMTSAYRINSKSLRVGERQKQQRGRKSADDAEHQLDPDEALHEAAIDVARERTADAHGKEVVADDGGKLKDAVAEEIAGERAGDQLIDQAASRDEQHGDEEQDAHGLVNRGRNDDADAEDMAPTRMASAMLCSCTISFQR